MISWKLADVRERIINPIVEARRAGVYDTLAPYLRQVVPDGSYPTPAPFAGKWPTRIVAFKILADSVPVFYYGKPTCKRHNWHLHIWGRDVWEVEFDRKNILFIKGAYHALCRSNDALIRLYYPGSSLSSLATRARYTRGYLSLRGTHGFYGERVRTGRTSNAG